MCNRTVSIIIPSRPLPTKFERLPSGAEGAEETMFVPFVHNQDKYRWLLLIVCITVVFNWLPMVVQAGVFTDQTATLLIGPTPDPMTQNKAAWADYNNDGYVDLLLKGGQWRNNAGTGFTRITESDLTGPYGVRFGIWADFDNDGRVDLYDYSTHNLFRNQSTPTTTSYQLMSLPTFPTGSSRSVSWGDYNNDGYVDLYLGGYEDPSYVPDVILQNNQGVSFTKIWQQSGDIDPARGVTSCDFDRDGDQDIYVSNYRLQENLLWQNNGSGSFTNEIVSVGADEPTSWQGYSGAHTIGSAWGDLDNDGHMDLFVGNFAHPDGHFGPGIPRQPESQFLRNMGPDAQGNYHFEDKSATAGLAYQESYASPTLGDYDNDGDLDLFLTTSPTYGDHSVLYRNDGNWNFTDVTAHEAAWGDFDNDGDLDLATGGKLFVNGGNTNNWLKIKLNGNGTTINSAAIGAQVRINIGAQTLTRQVEGGTGEGNQNDLMLHFGLGNYAGSTVDLEVIWPNGFTETISGVGVNQSLEISTDYETPAVHYTLKETSPGTWEVLIEVTGSTAGLSAYEFWVDNVDPSLVSFDENVLATVVGEFYTPVGFMSLLQGDVGGNFNAGNFQGSGASAIQGVGMIEIDEPGSFPGYTPHVQLDVPALLGILSTPAGLGEDDFRAITAGLLNASGDDFLNTDSLVPTLAVIQFVFLMGDANGDGVVSAGDYASVQANFGNTGSTGGGLDGDANGDGVVSAGDYAAVQANFGNTAATTVTPEPATLSLLVLGAIAVLRRRSRRNVETRTARLMTRT